MRCVTTILSSFLVIFGVQQAQAKIIHVPADSSTLQGGINGAIEGDTVLVDEGTYYENIDFLGKNILVASHFILDQDTATIASTIIDGTSAPNPDSNYVVRFVSGEDTTACINGFSIQNGQSGVCVGLYPSRWGDGRIENNIIKNNDVGISQWVGRVIIKNNTIESNGLAIRIGDGEIGCIFVNDNLIRENQQIMLNTAAKAPFIISGNTFEQNQLGLYFDSGLGREIYGNIFINNPGYILWFGGGASGRKVSHNTIVNSGSFIQYSGSPPVIEKNQFIDAVGEAINVGVGGFGVQCSISNNLIVRSKGYAIRVGEGQVQAFLKNNTIVDCYGGIFSATGCGEIFNNVICGSITGSGIQVFTDTSLLIHHNDVWNNAGGDFSGCSPSVGDTGWGTNFNGTPCDSFYNITNDPFFAGPTEDNFSLACSSVCIDAGDSTCYVPHDSGGCRIDIGSREHVYILADANSDCLVNVADVVFVINYLLVNGPPPCPYHAGDVNCDGEVNIADPIYLINHLFLGGPPPCEP